MTVEGSVSSVAPLALVVRTKGTARTLEPGGSYQVGRDPAADIRVDDARVSWRHGVLRTDENGWIFEDLGSTNGTFVGGRRIRRAGIEGEIRLRLGHPENGVQLTCSVPPMMDQRTGVDRDPTSIIQVRTQRLRIGRAPDNDIVLPDLIVSRHHAELREVMRRTARNRRSRRSQRHLREWTTRHFDGAERKRHRRNRSRNFSPRRG